MDNEKLLEDFTSKLNREVLSSVDLQWLKSSYRSEEKDYAKSVLKQMHDAFVEVYGTDTMDRDNEFIIAPAVIKVRETGNLCLGLVQLDIASSGEHWGTDFITPYGVLNFDDKELNEKQLEYVRSFMPYDYYYTINIPDDIHVDMDKMPDDVRGMVAYCNEAYEQNMGGMSLS